MIEFESVSKVYRDGTKAVEDLSLSLPSGQISVFVGPSGCGKTTTLRMINRMLEPTSGRITWDNTPLKSKRKTTLRREMGYVIQSGGLFPHRTVLDNIGTVPGLLGWDKSKTRKRSLELLGAVGLDRALAERYPAQLSGGQQQRVGVARALAADPLVLLMDEPFSAVDPVVRADLHELFLDLQRELSKTIILITHDIDEAIKLGDQVAILRVGGTLAQVGTPQEVLDDPADAFVEGFVGRDRGYRALSFLPASGLSLDRVQAVRDPASAAGASEPILVVDSDAKPVGWVDPSRPGNTLGLGSIFDPDTDTLRAALDSALTSPVGLAVAVHGDTGRYAGVVASDAILSQVTGARASVADAISGRSSDATPDPTPVAELPVASPVSPEPYDVPSNDEPSNDEIVAAGPAAELETPTEIRDVEPEPHAATADEGMVETEEEVMAEHTVEAATPEPAAEPGEDNESAPEQADRPPTFAPPGEVDQSDLVIERLDPDQPQHGRPGDR